MWHEVMILSTILVASEQKPSIYFESETDLLEEIRGIRNTDNADILISSKIQRFYNTDMDEAVPVPAEVIPELNAPTVENEEIKEDHTTEINEDIDDNDRKIRDIESSPQTDEIPTVSNINVTDSTTSSEEMTISNEETTTTVPCDKVDILAVFLKFATKNFEDDSEIERRSVKEIDLEEIKGENVEIEEDLDTAANTVFRPLFAYRQQEARRRRFRTLNN